MKTCVLLVMALVPASAQVTTGSIFGYILDPARRPVAGAEVRAVNPERGLTRRTVSDSAGFYLLPELPPAPYTVSAAAQGFEAAQHANIQVLVNSRRNLDMLLALTKGREQIEVTESLGTLQTASSELGTVLDRAAIGSLPLNRRDFLQLALLSPGVLPPVQDSELSKRGRFAMHANGAREELNNYLLDGVDNNDQYENTYVFQPSVDSIQEFKILTNGYSAEYGRNAGAQVNVITQSGGNHWHGGAYEYLRNRIFEARNFFDGPEKPKFIRNQFGAEMAGPARKDRSFFFVNFDSLRERRGLTRLATVPTAAQRQGDFSASPRTIRDPYTRQPFPGNRIPIERIAPLASGVVELFPLPNRPGISGNFLAQPVLTETLSQFNGRLDHRLSSQHQLTLRYSRGDQDIFEPYTQDVTAVPGFGDIVTNTGHNAMVHLQRVFGPRTVNSLRFGFNRAFRQALPQNYRTDAGRLWNVDWLKVRVRDFGFPSVTVAGFSQVGDATQLPLTRYTNTYQAIENLSTLRGNHSLKTGGEFRRIQLNGALDYFARGSLSFSGAISGLGLSDLLLGLPSFGIQSRFDNPQALRTSAYNAYFQDDWKAARTLTLNLGLRYEYNSPPVDPRDRMAAFDLKSRKVVRVGTEDVSRSGFRPDRTNFAPRAGFAWTPIPNLVIRGGYGLYYDAGMLVVSSALYFNPPYFNVRVFFPTRASLLTLNDPFPSAGGITPPVSPNTLSPDLTTAYLQHWNFDVQQQLGSATTLSLAYAGSKGTHLVRSRDLNQPRPGPGNVSARRPLPGYAGIFFTESGANSSFQSLQATLDRRLARRFSLIAAHTFSKSIDDTSAFLGNRADKNFPQDSLNFRAERGLSSFDMPHRFTTAYVYELPARHWWSRNTDIRGITTVESGRPFTPILRFDNSNTGNNGGIFGSDRPDLLRNPELSARSPERWFDVSAFAIPPRYRFGSAGRNIVRGPGLFSFDTAVERRILLREGVALSVDAEAFNLLNRAQFNLPERFADEPATFGRIFSAGPSRQVQFALRISF